MTMSQPRAQVVEFDTRGFLEMTIVDVMHVTRCGYLDLHDDCSTFGELEYSCR